MLTTHLKLGSRLFIVVSAALAACCFSNPATAQQPTKAPPQQANHEDQEDLINPDRPGIADGSQVVGRAKSGRARFQIETAIQSEFRSSGAMTDRRLFFPTLLRFGIDNAWEARIETLNGFTLLRTFDPAGGVNRTDGYSPISVGFKYHWQDSGGPGHPSLGTIFRLFVPSGSSDFRSRRFQADWRLAADQDLTRDGSWSLNPNFGVGIYDDGQSGVFAAGLFALTLNYFNRDKTINPFVDLGLQAPEERHGKTSLILDTGVAFIIKPNLQLDLSIGAGALGRTPPHPFWAAGISQRF